MFKRIFAISTACLLALSSAAMGEAVPAGVTGEFSASAKGMGGDVTVTIGLKDGAIDIIATDHAPHSAEEKAKPFAEAPSGIIGLETALALGITNLVRKGHLTLMQLIEKMSLNPAKLYKLDKGAITEGADADLVIFNEGERWHVGPKFVSKAANTPFAGEDLYGKVKYTICAGNVVYEDGE